MSARDVRAYRRDAAASGALLNAEEREALVRKYLPEKPAATTARDDTSHDTFQSTGTARRPSAPRRKPIRTFLKSQLYFVVFALLQLFCGLYVRVRRGWRIIKALILRVLYHHHRTPELIENDVAGLSRLPKHLSVILQLPEAAASTSASRRSLRRRLQNRRKRIERQQKQQQRQQRLRNNEGIGARRADIEDDSDRHIWDIAGHGYDVELEALLDDVAELSAWSAAAGIPLLSIYERRGVLKEMIPGVHEAVRRRLISYFGERRAPTLQVRAPHVPSYLSGGDDNDENDDGQTQIGGGTGNTAEKHAEFDNSTNGAHGVAGAKSQGSNTDNRDNNQRDGEGFESDEEEEEVTRSHLDLLLLSEDDGQATIVDLTKTLAEMSQKGRLSPRDVSLDLVEQELMESFSARAPDLLMLFGSSGVVLQGYPPWQLRLAEIFCVGNGSDGSSGGDDSLSAVDYPSWLRGLYRFAKAEMRLGK